MVKSSPNRPSAPAGYGDSGDDVADRAAEAALVVRMGEAALAWLQALRPDQRPGAAFPAPADGESDAERRRWFYTPTDHGGLTLGEQRPAQQRLAMQLVASGLSHAGFVTVATILGLENVLDQVEGGTVDWGHERGRDPSRYYLRVFGNPGERMWGWRFGGHHVSLNYLLAGGRVAALTPCFLGANPARSPLLGSGPLRPLAGVEDLARDLVCSLNGEWLQRARLAERAVADLVGVNRSELAEGDQTLPLPDIWRAPFTDPELVVRAERAGRDAEARSGYTEADHRRLALSRTPKGVAARELGAGQRDVLRALVDAYLDRAPEPVAARYRRRVCGDGSQLDDVHFAWAGSTVPGEPHYYRIQAPRLLIEYDNASPAADHAHSVWRDPVADFGLDVLGSHRREHHL